MKLSIITINRNNGSGLEKTIKSILAQTSCEFECIIVDGASTDGSVDVIRRFEDCFGNRLKWVSEPDTGIYNAMNKGIGMASGDYLQFLNSGDCLAANDIVERMFNGIDLNDHPSIIYGNMLKAMNDGRIVRDKSFTGSQVTLMGMYHGCLNHSPAFIQKTLFSKYGLYDESLRICSDWKWYMKAIVLGKENPVYVDIDVSLFDMNGISETNKELLENERRSLLCEMIPAGVLADYDRWYSEVKMIERLERYPALFAIIRFIERVVFKFERLINRFK